MPFTLKALLLGLMSLASLSLFACQGQFSALKGTGAEIEATDQGTIEGSVETGDLFIPGDPGIISDPANEGAPDRPGATNPSIPKDKGFSMPSRPTDTAMELSAEGTGDDDDEGSDAPPVEDEPNPNCFVKFRGTDVEIPCRQLEQKFDMQQAAE